MLKSSEFSGAHSTSENYDVFTSRDEIHLVFTEKGKFSFYFILFIDYMQCFTNKKGSAENVKSKNFSKPK